jgi:SAM-dependent methyltransferase
MTKNLNANAMSKYSNSLRLGKDNIWSAVQSSEPISYPVEASDRYASLEDNSFWFMHRNHCLEAIIQAFPPQEPFFDIGGGNGFVSAFLQSLGYQTILIEPSSAAISNASIRGVKHLINSSLVDANFYQNSIPAIGIFDVIEHIKMDESWLDHLYRILIPGGRIYITVPAYQCMWSTDDVYAGHFRRYSQASLEKILCKSGFVVEYISYFFSILVAPILIARTLPSVFGLIKGGNPNVENASHGMGNVFIRRLLIKMLSYEKALIRQKHHIVFGSSLIAVAQKNENRI